MSDRPHRGGYPRGRGRGYHGGHNNHGAQHGLNGTYRGRGRGYHQGSNNPNPGPGAGVGGGAGAGGSGNSAEKPRKENILDLGKYMDKRITVKFNGGREVDGVLKGFDALMNLVLDDVKEVMRDDEGNKSSRPLGLVVARGTLLVLISPVDGSEIIENPFAQADSAEAI